MRLAATAVGLLALLPVFRLDAQSDRSLTDIESGILLAQGATIIVPTEPEDAHDTSVLQERLLLARASIKELTESLAIANAEAEMFKRQSADLALKMEALGMPSLEKDQSKLEQRLLSAVRDLRLLKKQNEEAVSQLLRLSEAIQILIKSTEGVDPKLRLSIETEIRKTGEVLGAGSATKTESVEVTLTDGMVVDVKEELSLIIANLGEKQGVRIGMPFQVWRESKRIGEVRVIDVRERISGAVIQSLDSEKVPIKTGDRLKVDAKK